MSYIKELTETNPVSLLDHLWSTTPTTTLIFTLSSVKDAVFPKYSI